MSEPQDRAEPGEAVRAAARQVMRRLLAGMGLDYDTVVADYPGGPAAYERAVRGLPRTPADQAAWEAEQQAGQQGR